MDAGGVKTITAKVPASLLARLDEIAEFRSVSRSLMIRELVEALADGKVILPISSGFEGSIADLSTSKVGQAVQKRAQLDVAAALQGDRADPNRGSTAPVVNPWALDYDEVALLAVRLIAEGRC